MRINMKCDATEEAGNTGPFEKGQYSLLCTGVEMKDTKTGRQMAILELTVKNEKNKGRKMWHNITFIPKGEKGHGFLVRALHAFGMKHDGDVNFDSDEFKGKTCAAEVGIEEREYNGRIYTKNIIENFIVDEPDESEPAF